jgi:hypothetical protein
VLDSAYSPSTSTADAEIQQWRLNFQREVRIIQKRAHDDYAATERDANKARRANANYSATKRDADKAWRVNEDYAAAKRDANEEWRANAESQRRPGLKHCNLLPGLWPSTTQCSLLLPRLHHQASM